MKLILPDRTFIYYMYDRTDGKSEGIRVGRSTGVCGFVSDDATTQQQHPIRLTLYDAASSQIPVNRDELPPILRNVLGTIESEHPEINALLTGAISFDDVLR